MDYKHSEHKRNNERTLKTKRTYDMKTMMMNEQIMLNDQRTTRNGASENKN